MPACLRNGDVNGDGIPTPYDLQRALWISAPVSGEQPFNVHLVAHFHCRC